MKRLVIATLLLATTAPAFADRYENSTYTRPLTEFCQRTGAIAQLFAEHRDDGFQEQALRAMVVQLSQDPAQDPRIWADAKVNLTMIYHVSGWTMSTPDQIAQGAYENCLAKHGSETWWREPAVAGAP